MPAHVLLSVDELAVRRATVWLEYQSDHVPCNTQCQVFTPGDADVKDQTARSHVMVLKLVTKPDRLAKEMLLASDDMAREEIRSEYKNGTGCMKGRSRYFAKYTTMVTIQPAGTAKLTSTTSNDAIDSRPRCTRSACGNGPST
jgi:hypothetical protein